MPHLSLIITPDHHLATTHNRSLCHVDGIWCNYTKDCLDMYLLLDYSDCKAQDIDLICQSIHFCYEDLID